MTSGTAPAFLPDGFQVYFTEPTGNCYNYCSDPDALDDIFMDFLRSAQDSVNACFYELRWMSYSCFPNPTGTLCDISDSVQVQVISDRDFASSNPDYDSLAAYGIEIAYDNMGLCPDDEEDFMHNKFCILDGQTVWTGSANMTYSGCWWNNNNAIVIDCPELAQAYGAEFAEMWDTPPFHTFSRFHTCKLGTTPTPDTAFCNGVPVEYFFSPPSCLEDRLVEAIDGAQENIYFCVYVFTSPGLRNALIDAHDRGVWVEGVIDHSCLGTTGCQYNTLVANGVPVCTIDWNCGYMHHKFMVVDHNTAGDPKVFTGSNNWSYSADTDNDENMIVVHDQNVAAEYYNEFRRIRHQCAPLAGGTSAMVAFDDNIYIGTDTVAVITVIDGDSLANCDSLAVDTTVVTVQSHLTDTAGELVTLIETGPNTGQFSGTVGFEDSVTAHNGKVAMANEEQLTVTYSDALNDFGLGVLVTDDAYWYVSSDSFPRVYVNELYPTPTAGDGAEFVEIYNPNSKAVDISGWRLQDDPFWSGNIWEFPDGTTIPAEGFLVIARDGSDTIGTGFLEAFGFHADYEYYDVPNETTKVDDSLAVNMIQVTATTGDNQIQLDASNDGAFLYIGGYYTTGIIVDSLSYSTAPDAGSSLGRCPDGESAVLTFDVPTPGEANCLLPITDLSIALADTSLVLIWSPPAGGAGADHYVVYRDTLPDFDPQPGDSIGSATDTTYTDDSPGVVGEAGRGYYYAVKAVAVGGYKSEASNVVGEFDVELINSGK
jgi:phosphatidylserine/phosphatidylglycerophosphate/cardiolipin synthase-like enzyme